MYHKKAILSLCCVLLVFFCNAQSLTAINSDTMGQFDTQVAALANSFKERKINAVTLRKLKADNAFWYADLKPIRTHTPANQSKGLSFLQQPWFSFVIWIIIAGSFSVVLFWYLASLNIKLFNSSPKTLVEKEMLEISNDLLHIDFTSQIIQAEQVKDYRTATRLLFLQTLQLLARKSYITYQSGTTNRQYIEQVSHTPLKASFITLTHHFEYCWYGNKSINSDTYYYWQQIFHSFHQSVVA